MSGINALPARMLALLDEDREHRRTEVMALRVDLTRAEARERVLVEEVHRLRLALIAAQAEARRRRHWWFR